MGGVCIGILVLVGVFVTLTLKEKSAGLIEEQSGQNSEGEVTLVRASDVDELLENPQMFVVDVHTPEQMHIPGTDAFIPYDKISQSIDQLPVDKNTPILVYCRSGSMSSWASEDLIKLGYTNVYDLEGGTNAYKESHVKVGMVPETQDLGTVIYGDVAHSEFKLFNYSSASLEVTKVTTSCGCTKAKVQKIILEPYEETTVQVSFDPAVHKDDTDLGDISRTIFVETNNPNFSQVTAGFTAKVIKR